MEEQDIVRDGDTGKAIISGADIPVDAVLERLALTGSVERVLEIFPSLTREGFNAALRFAAIAVQREVRYEQLPPGVGVHVVREPAAAYGLSTDVDEVLGESEAAWAKARCDLELMQGLRNGFRDLKAGRVMPHAEFMAELRAMFPA
ncbi:MAG: DUF433 domain-containing protein [Longimicrobiaceae bacterium]